MPKNVKDFKLGDIIYFTCHDDFNWWLKNKPYPVIETSKHYDGDEFCWVLNEKGERKKFQNTDYSTFLDSYSGKVKCERLERKEKIRRINKIKPKKSKK